MQVLGYSFDTCTGATLASIPGRSSSNCLGLVKEAGPMCARVSYVTTDLLHSLCIPFRVHITRFRLLGGGLLGGGWALGNFSHTMPVSR